MASTREKGSAGFSMHVMEEQTSRGQLRRVSGWWRRALLHEEDSWMMEGGFLADSQAGDWLEFAFGSGGELGWQIGGGC